MNQYTQQARRVGGRGGFTLIELILALAMTVMIGSVLASTLFTAFRARSSAEAAMREAQGIGAIGEVLAEDLAAALPPTGVYAGEFVGLASSISFHASGGESRAALPGDIKHVEIGVFAERPNTLVRRVTANLIPGATVVPPEEEVLCGDVTEFSLQYYDIAGAAGWVEEWYSSGHQDVDGLDALPVAVRFSVTLSPPGEKTRKITKVVTLPCAQPAMSGVGGGL